jgi:hypothetical protein
LAVRRERFSALLPAWRDIYRAQIAHAVGHVGLIGALRRIGGEPDYRIGS